MPWLPIYANANDFPIILDWLNRSEDLAFIVSDGRSRWRAVESIDTLDNNRFCLWHVPSGPLPLLHAKPSREVGSISDPWKGWKELREGADASQPGRCSSSVVW